jgi:N-methylhydantoinase B/oxoprolinase/acetone carboxylase alpha subunit
MRDPEKVRTDVLDEFITIEAAAEAYGVPRERFPN